MKEDRQLSFLESMAVSALTGGAAGAFCGLGKVPDENRDYFTRIMVDLALKGAQNIKERDREDYFNPGWK